MRDLDELHAEFRANWLPDATFKDEFQRNLEALLPDIGDDDLMPRLLTVHITDFDPVVFGIDLYAIAVDDFDDIERRHHYIRMLGEQSAMDGRKVVMAIMASEIWTSSNMVRSDGSQRYKRASDDPKRKEAIAVFALSLDHRSAMATCRVTRTLGGKFKTFGTLEMGYSFEPESTMAGMYPAILDNFWLGFMTEKVGQLGI